MAIFLTSPLRLCDRLFQFGYPQLSFVKSFPDASPNQVAFSLTIINGLCCLVYWSVLLALRLTVVEEWYWDMIPWSYVLSSAAATLGTWTESRFCSPQSIRHLVFVGVAYLYNYGLAVSSPFFISLGALLDAVVMTGRWGCMTSKSSSNFGTFC